jgi:D-alanyl-lipoteichoic acid acyltransferase DltB (MBOAT superfamily)
MDVEVKGSVGTALPRLKHVPWTEAGQVAFVALQLVVVLLLARAFEIEHANFYGVVLPLTIGGFVLHHWLPRRLQAWFFVGLSAAGIVLVLGPWAGACLAAVGLALIGLCHVPIAFRWRVLLVVATAVVLVAMRASWLPTPWPAAIWPVLASMFMFRLGIYLYDLAHEKKPASPAAVLSYFFMLPNTVFLLFPVIDWKTFRQSWFDRPALQIYNEGVRWIFRGVTHLVLYRIIAQNLVLSPNEVSTTAGLVQFLVANFGLYLRVSGQFHMIVGLMHLFGYRLPESHRFFYLASSFTDLWRRINIYWKDFMQKMVYLPVVFELKRRSETTRILVATLCVIAATWVLHSYQWFWLLGNWLISPTDAAFWGLIGMCLIASTLLEQRRGRQRQLSSAARRPGWKLAVQTAGMFALMCLLWGLWTSPTFKDFGALLSSATFRPVDGAAVLGVLGTVAVSAWVAQRFALGAPSALGIARPRWQHPLVTAALPLSLFWAAGGERAAASLPPELHAVARKARTAALSAHEAEQMQRGYYEEIMGVTRFDSDLWELYARDGEKQAPPHQYSSIEVDDGFGNRCLRSLSGLDAERRGYTFSANRWGLRDKDYPQQPGPSTRRIAVIGPSLVMGVGVNDGEPFEQVIEDRLNAEYLKGTGRSCELLNFGLPRASLAESATIVASGRVASFAPHVVLVVGNPHLLGSIDIELVRMMKDGQAVPRAISDVVGADQLDAAMSETEVKRLLAPHGEALLRSSLTIIADATREMGAAPVFALIPMPQEELTYTRGIDVLMLAEQAGFTTIDLRDVYDGHEREELMLSGADHHPNAFGHRVIAEGLYEKLIALPGIVADDP